MLKWQWTVCICCYPSQWKTLSIMECVSGRRKTTMTEPVQKIKIQGKRQLSTHYTVWLPKNKMQCKIATAITAWHQTPHAAHGKIRGSHMRQNTATWYFSSVHVCALWCFMLPPGLLQPCREQLVHLTF